MLLSLALLFLTGLSLSALVERFHLPRLIGLLLTGILLGPFVLNLLSPDLLGISEELRKIALIIILLRAGLSFSLDDLKTIGRPACLLSFLPACFEILGVLIFAPLLLSISRTEALLLGSVLAAVSPAVVVPGMLKLMEKHYGTNKKIPQMLLAGSSLDDIFVLVLFSLFLGMAEGSGFSSASLLRLPVSLVLGCALGIGSGFLLSILFHKIHLRDSLKILLLLSLAFLLVSVEDLLTLFIPFSGMFAVISMAITLAAKRVLVSERLSLKLNKIWIAAEILLFVLVGAALNLTYALSTGPLVLLVLVFALIFRMIGVFFSLFNTPLTLRERCFCMVAYLPKATVQAAIGSLPLSAGLSCGPIILSFAVLAIFITAPLGALGIERLAPKLLTKEPSLNS